MEFFVHYVFEPLFFLIVVEERTCSTVAFFNYLLFYNLDITFVYPDAHRF